MYDTVKSLTLLIVRETELCNPGGKDCEASSPASDASGTRGLLSSKIFSVLSSRPSEVRDSEISDSKEQLELKDKVAGETEALTLQLGAEAESPRTLLALEEQETGKASAALAETQAEKEQAAKQAQQLKEQLALTNSHLSAAKEALALKDKVAAWETEALKRQLGKEAEGLKTLLTLKEQEATKASAALAAAQSASEHAARRQKA
jgi:hypothetical protein